MSEFLLLSSQSRMNTNLASPQRRLPSQRQVQGRRNNAARQEYLGRQNLVCIQSPRASNRTLEKMGSLLPTKRSYLEGDSLLACDAFLVYRRDDDLQWCLSP